MTPSSARGAWDLDENEAMALPRGRIGTVVRVHRGTVLVTQEGDREDHVLEPGDELMLRRRGRPVAWAFTDATISLCAVTAASPSIAPPARPRAPDLGHQMVEKVAHELKNSLTGMKALVQLGLRNPVESPSHVRLGLVEKEIAQMQEILNRFLSSTRPLEEVKPARIELGPLVSDTLLLLSGQASDARVRLLARGDATVEADPRRLKEALHNLVANAIEATPPGGEVVVEVRPSAGQAEIVVRDTGRGMPPETLRRLGTPFFTTREDGTGLGVVLARSVIALHGGSLRYESEPGKGTTVRATLPSRAQAA
jgi:two-component system, NtrC family, sensor histidine kinase HydH